MKNRARMYLLAPDYDDGMGVCTWTGSHVGRGKRGEHQNKVVLLYFPYLSGLTELCLLSWKGDDVQ